MTRGFFCLLLLWLAAQVQAQVSEAVLVVRSGPDSGFRLPANTGFAESTVALNDQSQLAIRISSLPPQSQRGIWLGNTTQGEVVATGNGDWLFSDVGLNNIGRVVWVQSFSANDGIYQYDPVSDLSFFLTTDPFGSSGWGSVQINQNNQLGYRASFANGRVWTSWAMVGGTQFHAIETGLDPQEPYAFLFTPAFNNQRQIAGKARLGGLEEFRPDQILITEAGQQVSIVAEDTDSDAASPFAGFDNSVAVNDDGAVAFVANIAGATSRGVFRVNADAVVELGRENTGPLGDIEFFAVAMNNSGKVVFRAFDDQGRRAIWLGQGPGTPQRLIGEDDLVMTDIGPARIQSPTGGPVFSGGVAINNLDEVAFTAVLTEPDNSSALVGLGSFILPPPAELIFSDGFEDAP
ncbi:MAG: hypothetical protein Tsb002_09480 [Wenzhouxiangellaceae bacterium]